MRSILSLLVLFSMNAVAGHVDKICGNAFYRPPIFESNLVAHGNVVDDFAGKRIFSAPEKILALVKDDESIWALTPSSLYELNAEGVTLSHTEIYGNRSLVVAGNKIIIVKENGEVFGFDKRSKKDLWATGLSEVKGAKALGAVFDGKNIQVVMTSTMEGGFNGIATIDSESGKFISKAGYDYVRAGVIDPEATGKWHQGNLILNNGGWVHVISAAKLSKGKTMRPEWKAVSVGFGQNHHYMMLKGGFYFEENTLKGCGLYKEQEAGWEYQLRMFSVPL